MRPVLPRISSGTSGFFFCGMIEEPVQKLSDSSMKPNWAEDQMISSSEKRDRCIIRMLAAALNSMAKSRSDTASREFSAGVENPNSSAV